MKPPEFGDFLAPMLRKARRDKGLSQLELGEKLNVHRNTIIRWESGINEPLSEQIGELEKVLDRPSSYFYAIKEKAPAPKYEGLGDLWLEHVPLERLQELTPEALRNLRRDLGLTIREIAKKVDVPSSYIRDWIAKRRIPEIGDLKKLRKAFNDDFDPTPMLARKAAKLLVNLDPGELARRLERVEKQVLKLQQRLDRAGISSE